MNSTICCRKNQNPIFLRHLFPDGFKREAITISCCHSLTTDSDHCYAGLFAPDFLVFQQTQQPCHLSSFSGSSVLYCSDNNVECVKKQAVKVKRTSTLEECAALIMEELGLDRLGYIEVEAIKKISYFVAQLSRQRAWYNIQKLIIQVLMYVYEYVKDVNITVTKI